MQKVEGGTDNPEFCSKLCVSAEVAKISLLRGAVVDKITIFG